MDNKNVLQRYYDRFCKYMQDDTKGVEICIYATSGILFAVAYYQKRPITKFGKPSDIPNHFIKNKIRQYGSIAGIDPTSNSGLLLLINHKPPLNLILPSRKVLPVKLAGVKINSNGFAWLQTIVVNHKVEFVPVAKNIDNAECQVTMFCPNNKKVRLDLSEALLSLGFGKLTAEPANVIDDPILKRYYQYLEYIEKQAKKERQGLWRTSLPPISWPIRKFKDTYNSIILAVLPANHRLPELVR